MKIHDVTKFLGHAYENGGELIMGRGSYVNQRTRLRCEKADIVIGEDCTIASDVFMTTAPRAHYKPPHNKPEGIVIGNNVWIGHGAMISGGVTIGDYAVIGMGTVVTKDVPSFAVMVGNPGEIVGPRPDVEEII